MQDSLFEKYNNLKIKKPAKNENRLRLVDRLSEVTGWSKKSIHFQTLKFPDSWLEDALSHCQHYSDPKARNAKFKEFIQSTKM